MEHWFKKTTSQDREFAPLLKFAQKEKENNIYKNYINHFNINEGEKERNKKQEKVEERRHDSKNEEEKNGKNQEEISNFYREFDKTDKRLMKLKRILKKLTRNGKQMTENKKNNYFYKKYTHWQMCCVEKHI